MSGRDAAGRMIADPAKFPDGFKGLADYVHGKGLKIGLYSAASSVVCSGRVGSLYNEEIDAETFASWGVDYAKYVSLHTRKQPTQRPRAQRKPPNPLFTAPK